MGKYLRVVVVLCGTALFAGGAAAADFDDPTTANVLRQIDPAAGVNLVTRTYERVGVGGGSQDGTDGSTSSDWYGMDFDDAGDSVSCTYQLPGERLVGSYMVQMHSDGELPARFVLEGWDGGAWVELDSVEPPTSSRWTATFDPAAVTQLRYTAHGPSANNMYMRLTELHVYMALGQSVGLDEGYNFLPDQVFSTSTAANSLLWAANSGGPDTLKDANYSSHVKATDPSGEGGNRSFVTYSFLESVLMSAATLGCHDGQRWDNWEIYTSNADVMPEMQNVVVPEEGETLADSIVDAGWTLQHAHEVGRGRSRSPWTGPAFTSIWRSSGMSRAARPCSSSCMAATCPAG